MHENRSSKKWNESIYNQDNIWNSALYKNNEFAVYGVMFRDEFIPAQAEYGDKDISILLANVLSEEEINLSEVRIGYVFDNKFTELEQKFANPQINFHPDIILNAA